MISLSRQIISCFTVKSYFAPGRKWKLPRKRNRETQYFNTAGIKDQGVHPNPNVKNSIIAPTFCNAHPQGIHEVETVIAFKHLLIPSQSHQNWWPSPHPVARQFHKVMTSAAPSKIPSTSSLKVFHGNRTTKYFLGDSGELQLGRADNT